LDVAQFDDVLSRAIKTTPENASTDLINKLIEVVMLHRGDFLHGIFDEWCSMQREVFRGRYLSALEFLVHAYIAHKSWMLALLYSQKLLSIDPLQEHIHRVAMHCCYSMGNRPAAIRQYAICAQILRHELDIEPMKETTRLYETILAEAMHPGESKFAAFHHRLGEVFC
jgi:DNA-binding SARP family transcriptional activator